MPDDGTISSQENFITWEIPDFVSLANAPEIRSEEFSYNYTRFRFFIRPHGVEKFNSVGWIGIQLLRYDYFYREAGPIEVSIMNGGKKMKSSTIYYRNEAYRNEKFIEWTEFTSRKDELAPNGLLTLLCELEDFRSNLEKCTQHEDASKRIMRDLQKLLNSGKNTDATLEVHGTKFPVHKGILAARSRRLSSIFDSENMQGSKNNFVLEDMELETFKDFLHYLYTGCVENLNPSKVRKLCAASNRYDVYELQLVCEKYMIGYIAVNNFVETRKIAAEFNMYELIENTESFFKENAKDIASSHNWMAYLKENTEKANELIIKAF